jgi:hypothetical protein
VQQAREFNRASYEHFRREPLRCLDVRRREACWAVVGELQDLYLVWDLLDDARRLPETRNRLDRLRRLKWLLGDEAYYSGAMPPCVPYWLWAYRD